MALTKDAAVKNAFGCAVFFPIVAEDIKDNSGNPTGAVEIKVVTDSAIINTTDTKGILPYWTGKNYSNKIIQIASEYTVATEGTFTGSLETTMYGPKTKAFLNRFAPMYNHPGSTAGVEMEELVDESGRKASAGSSSDVAIEDMLFGLFWGGSFEGTLKNKTATIYLKYALCSIGNETISSSYQSGQWMRRNFNLIGHYPTDDIILPINDLITFTENNDIGLEVKGIITDVNDTNNNKLILRKGIQIDEAFIEVEYNE